MPHSETSRGLNPVTADRDWPEAVIAGAFQTGVLGVRSLQRRGVRAQCFDGNPRQPGFRSVYGPALLCPNPDTDSNAWLRFMLELGDSIPGKPALICSSDQFVSAIARHQDALRETYLISPGIALQGLLADKESQYKLACKSGMPMPRTQLVESEADVTRFATDAHFPCLLKPTHFRLWQRFPHGHPLSHQKVAVANNAEELRTHYRLSATVSAHGIVQEIITGPDTNKRVYLACYDRDGHRIANAMFRELRCDPVGFGPATISEPIVDEETDRVCDQFLRRIGYVGICEIEMKWDQRDGEVKLIEANPRLSGGGDAAPYAGVDLCWIHYLDLIGRAVEPVRPETRDFRHVVLRAEGRALPAYWRAGMLSWREIAASYRWPLAFYDLDLRDLRYSLETLFIAARLFVTELFRSRTA